VLHFHGAATRLNNDNALSRCEQEEIVFQNSTLPYFVLAGGGGAPRPGGGGGGGGGGPRPPRPRQAVYSEQRVSLIMDVCIHECVRPFMNGVCIDFLRGQRLGTRADRMVMRLGRPLRVRITGFIQMVRLDRTCVPSDQDVRTFPGPVPSSRERLSQSPHC
jgi:hypothetical protein